MVTLKCLIGIFWLVSPAISLYSSQPNIITLTVANFDRLVLQGDTIWVVTFYNPGCNQCQDMAPEYIKAANALKGVVKFGAVNILDQKTLRNQYDIKYFPTTVMFGINKNEREEYTNEKTALGIITAVLSAIKRKIEFQLGRKIESAKSEKKTANDVIQLTDLTFNKLVMKSDDAWLVEFYAPWCGYCKNLEPHYRKVATHLKDKMKVGALDAINNPEKADQFNISGYPTIKFFPAGIKGKSYIDRYHGPLNADSIIEWTLEKLVLTQPAPEVYELTSENILKKACDRAVLCIISIFPDIIDCQSRCRWNYITILRELAEKYKSQNFGWIWAEALKQKAVEDALDFGFGYPALAAINFKKMKYSVMKGSFSKIGIVEFLREVTTGRSQSYSFQNNQFPKIVTTEQWDGKDGMLSSADEIDYSDVKLDSKIDL